MATTEYWPEILMKNTIQTIAIQTITIQATTMTITKDEYRRKKSRWKGLVSVQPAWRDKVSKQIPA